MRHHALWIFALLAAVAAPAAAQPPQPPRDRTGPDALPPATPPSAQPGPPPLVQPAEPEPANATLPPETGGQLREVRVLEDAAGMDRDAVPPRAWRPMTDPASGIVLDHRAGEPLGAAWVRRQFDNNLASGAGAGRAVALVQQINRAFLSAGFVNSGLLVQPGNDPSVLTMRLVHGRLTVPPGGGQAIEVSFVGGHSRGLDSDYVRNRFPSAGRRPLSAVAIERDFRLLTEDPALRTVNAQLRPGAGPGEAGLALSVLPRERADFYLSAGNSRSPAVGGERVGVGAYLRHLITSGDLLSGETGLTRGVVDVAAAYSTPFFGSTIVNLRGSYNEAAVIDTPLLPLDIRTRDVSGQISILRQLIREPLTPAGDGRWSPSRILTAGIGISHRRQNSFLFETPFSFAPGSVDGRAEYSALRLLGDFVVRNVDQVYALSVTGTLGLFGTRPNQPLVISPDENFVTLLAQFNYARRLNPAGLELRARLTGQLASSVLYSGERLGVGGEQSVRGYRETLLLADQGVAGSVELALPFSLSGESGARRSFDWGAFSMSAFVDGAYVDNVEGPEPAPDTIASTGLSLTWQPAEAMSLRVTYGHALVEVDPTGTTDIQDRGFHFRLSIYPLRMFRLR